VVSARDGPRDTRHSEAGHCGAFGRSDVPAGGRPREGDRCDSLGVSAETVLNPDAEPKTAEAVATSRPKRPNAGGARAPLRPEQPPAAKPGVGPPRNWARCRGPRRPRTGSKRCRGDGRGWRVVGMPRCTIRFCQFARSFKDEKELPVRGCSAAQAHLTSGISGERSESAACRG